MNQTRTVKELNELIDTLVESVQSSKQEAAEIEKIKAGLEQHQARLQRCKNEAVNISDRIIENEIPVVAKNSLFDVQNLVNHQGLIEPDSQQTQYETAKAHFLQAAVALKDKQSAMVDADVAVKNKVKEIYSMQQKLKREAEEREKEAKELAFKRKKALKNKLLYTSLFIVAVAAFISLQMR
ncbi:hypothetical protein ACFFLZ_05615 [Photobacterium aphoticum]|uniref:Uncharacterized protein n=1 Tax=Photobacterium aphoticum TaxID=754436 RepID=A0A0J1GQ37_9GAMM|nr:hypothetical protein [Photobacterium aphoticum]KLV01873.1 hypothetical protein ABT58_05520 [Photobacterium aphoticum]PSU60102.1 hypothetical protein C9I90_00280 [Photobacterium aphoticum]GHA33193.1 hypothetical protein GCM10007086_03040 [Photobacterium aphoticum]